MNISKNLHRLPRVAMVLYLAWLLIVPVSAFFRIAGELKYLPGILAGLFPFFLFLVLTLVSWRKDLTGMIIFFLMTLLTSLAAIVSGTMYMIPGIIATLAIGLLFLASMVYRIRNRIPETEEIPVSTEKSTQAVSPGTGILHIRTTGAIAALVFLVLSMIPLVTWIIVFKQYETHERRVSAYTGIFSPFLPTAQAIAIFSFILCLVTVVLGFASWQNPRRLWRLISILCIVFGTLLGLMNLFQMM